MSLAWTQDILETEGVNVSEIRQIDPALIWKEKIRHLVSAIQNNARSHREVQNASRLIQTDHNERFAIELVQNANDQAIRAASNPAEARALEVKIVWRDGLLAVLNQGRGFDTAGLRAITSLALSDKTEAELIGNKGVGFKAVYEISDEPRIYSEGLCFSVPTRFSPEHLDQLEGVAKEVLAEPTSAAFAKQPDSLERLMHELCASPPFYYPRVLSSQDRLRDLERLGVTDLELVTAVVLPLRDGTSETVNRALERLRVPGALLFLPGVGRLTIDAPDYRSVIERDSIEELAPGIETVVIGVDGAESIWWRLSDVVRTDSLAKAARELELESWKDIDHAPVSVALPVPIDGRPLGSTGRFCMGLPTDQPTGLPIWVDGRFHGSLNRDGVDLHSSYNAEVLGGARKLVVKLLAYLRSRDDVDSKRAATLALERGAGALAEQPDWGCETVLCADGGFRSPDQVWLPRDRVFTLANGEETTAPFELLRPFRKDAAQLPEDGLLEHGDQVLRGLGVAEGGDAEWLARHGGHSPLELGAKSLQEREGDWGPFLEWTVSTFSAKALDEQRFLPTGGETAAPNQRIYLPDHGGEEPLLPLVSKRLHFLDDAVVARKGRKLTPLGNLLKNAELVRSPALDELLKQALVPALRDSDESTRWQLLSVGIKWLVRLKEEGRSKATDLRLLLPTRSGWKEAQVCYLGTGWGRRTEWHEQRLDSAYGDTRLRDWTEVCAKVPGADPDLWMEAMDILDVGDRPRPTLLKVQGAPFDSWDYRLRRRDDFESEIPAPIGDLFDDYLAWVGENIGSDWSHTRAHAFDAIHWVHGLEKERARQAIAELVLSAPDRYPLSASVGHGDRWTPAPAFWLHVVRGSEVTFGGKPPNTVWYIKDGEADRRWTRLATSVDERVRKSPAMLGELGVFSMDTAPVARLVDALHQLGTMLIDRPALAREPMALSFATKLWSRLSTRADQDGAEGLEQLGAGTLPLNGRHDLVARELEADVFVLIDDDKERARWLKDSAGLHRLPFRGEPPKRFVDQLQQALGAQRVRRASEQDVDPQFASTGPKRDLMDALRESEAGDIELELAALLTFATPRPTVKVPSEAYGELASVKLDRGIFHGGETAFFDRSLRVLHLAEGASTVKELWRIVGEGSRYLLEVFAGARSSGQSQAFLEDAGIGPTELNELEEGLGRAGYAAHAALFVLARWVQLRETETVESVAEAWTSPRRPEQLCEWLQVSEEPDWVQPLLVAGEAEGTPAALAAIGETVDAWQECRVALKQPLFELPETLQLWRETRTNFTAQLRAATARDWDADLAAAGGGIETLAGTQCPDGLKHRLPDRLNVEDALRDLADELALPRSPKTKGWEHYRDYGYAERTRDAKSAVELRLAEAEAACPTHDGQEVLEDERLQSLISDGQWAHWRIALQRLSALLKELAWPCHAEMQRKNAFINRPRLPAPPPDVEPEPEPYDDDDVESIMEPVESPRLDRRRLAPKLEEAKKGAARTGGAGGSGRMISERTRQKIGDQGEKFFFDALRSWHHQQGLELDESCWVSRARRRFGFPDGDDSLGYDFRIRDPGRPDGDGRLASPGAPCHVEVKTTNSGESAFPLSNGEWEHAGACSRGDIDATYVLVRISLLDGQPSIVDIVVDPVAAQKRGELRISPKDHWVALGERVAL